MTGSDPPTRSRRVASIPVTAAADVEAPAHPTIRRSSLSTLARSVSQPSRSQPPSTRSRSHRSPPPTLPPSTGVAVPSLGRRSVSHLDTSLLSVGRMTRSSAASSPGVDVPTVSRRSIRSQTRTRPSVQDLFPIYTVQNTVESMDAMLPTSAAETTSQLNTSIPLLATETDVEMLPLDRMMHLTNAAVTAVEAVTSPIPSTPFVQTAQPRRFRMSPSPPSLNGSSFMPALTYVGVKGYEALVPVDTSIVLPVPPLTEHTVRPVRVQHSIHAFVRDRMLTAIAPSQAAATGHATMPAAPALGSGRIYASRRIYTMIMPSASISDVMIPLHSQLRRFSPNGRYLVLFGKSMRAVQLYSFQGPCLYGAAAEIGNANPNALREMAFDHFFQSHKEIMVTQGNRMLCKDFCLFVHQSRFMIVASSLTSVTSTNMTSSTATTTGDEQQQQHHHPSAQTTPHSLDLITALDDVTFHCIDVEQGRLCSEYSFNKDYIFLNHHAGVHVCDDWMAVLSTQHQTVHILHIGLDGKMTNIRQIGYHNFNDDAAVIESLAEKERLLGQTYETQPASILSGLKHRFLVFLHKNAQQHPTHPKNAIRLFYYHLPQLLTFVIWKIQFISKKLLLFKIGNPDYVIGRTTDTSSQITFFVIYDLETTEIVHVYDNASESLTQLLMNYWSPLFRAYGEEVECCFETTPNNNAYEREQLQKQLYIVRHAKNGGHLHAIRRVLSALPCPTQSFHESPYFDAALFSFDDKLISSLDRPKQCPDFPVKFYSRQRGDVAFRLLPGLALRSSQRTGRRYMVYIVHPTMPFIISVMHTLMQPTIVNFHYFSTTAQQQQ